MLPHEFDAFQLQALRVDEVVQNMSKMLRRLIGEHITFQTRHGSGGAPVFADTGMLEQVILNLAVNSRDAMPKGGALTLETETVEIQNPKPRQRPGRYVRLTVSDSGCGIAPEHLDRIFEPFFTTKEVGKGTGLGLATVFGIVKQHNGWIEVESQVGQGTKVQVYLPRHETDIAVTPAETPASGTQQGTETILLVEDEESVRALAGQILIGHGYRVHEAACGEEALDLWARHQAQIDLLFTDIVMPGNLTGLELGQRLMKDKAGLKVVYASGYTDEMLDGAWTLRQTLNFLEKPYTPDVMLRRIRAVLNAPASGHPSGK